MGLASVVEFPVPQTRRKNKQKQKRRNWSVVATPQIGRFETTGSVYLLATLNDTKKRLVATHYATCVRTGGRPLWAVYTITGKAPQLFGSKREIIDHVPGHLWKRVPIRRQAVGLAEKTPELRYDTIRSLVNRKA
jgi:hypothetical protein